jgi:hypothetical protein
MTSSLFGVVVYMVDKNCSHRTDPRSLLAIKKRWDRRCSRHISLTRQQQVSDTVRQVLPPSPAASSFTSPQDRPWITATIGQNRPLSLLGAWRDRKTRLAVGPSPVQVTVFSGPPPLVCLLGDSDDGTERSFLHAGPTSPCTGTRLVNNSHLFLNVAKLQL